jgi:hypothetical protein
MLMEVETELAAMTTAEVALQVVTEKGVMAVEAAFVATEVAMRVAAPRVEGVTKVGEMTASLLRTAPETLPKSVPPARSTARATRSHESCPPGS